MSKVNAEKEPPRLLSAPDQMAATGLLPRQQKVGKS